MKKIKNKLYNWFVRKNGRVWYEYERYVRENIEEHKTNRMAHIKILLKLNWFYRVKKGNTPYLYWDVPLTPMLQAEKTDVNFTNKKNMTKMQTLKLPSLEPESKTIKRLKPQFLVKRAMLYDIVSFDIFDTLLLRNVSNPKTVFLLVEHEIKISGFAKLRVDIEQRLRKESEELYGHREITIRDIYLELAKETGISCEEGIRKEFEVECKIIVSNPYMKYVYDMLKESGQNIIYTSDFYYPKEYLKELLELKGYEVTNNLFVSCDYQKSKIDKRLYCEVKNSFPDKTIFHIGDNRLSDVKCAQEMEIKSFYYENVNAVGNKYRAEGMSELIGSAYAGIINNYLYNGLNTCSASFEYGFIYGGLYVFGFCNYIYKLTCSEKIDKVIFLARDGDIYKKAFNYLYKDIETSYMFWSREIGTKYCISEERYSFLNRMIRYKAKSTKKYKIINIIDDIAVKEFSQLVLEHLDGEELLSNDNVEILIKLVIENIKIIEDYYEKKYKIVDEYLEYQIQDCERVLIVDVGWNGSGPLQLKREFEKINSSIVAKCVVAGNIPSNIGQSDINLLNENIYSYLFSGFNNRIMYDTHKSSSHNNFLFEMFTQSSEPSFGGIIENDIKLMEFQYPEVENYEMINEIQKGIMEFVKLWKNHFVDFSFMYNIAGYDAYCPFRLVKRSLEYFRVNFPDYILSRAVGLHDEEEIETLSEYLK